MSPSLLSFEDLIADTHVERVIFDYRHTQIVIVNRFGSHKAYKSEFSSCGSLIKMISISYRDHFRGDSSFNPVSFLKIPEFREHYKRIQQEIREKIENSPEAREVVNRKFLDEMRGEIEKVMDRYLKNQPNVRIPLDSLIDEATLGVQSSYARHVLKA